MSTVKTLLAAGLVASLIFLGGAQSWARPRSTISSYACKCTCSGLEGSQTKLFTVNGTSSAACISYNQLACYLTREDGTEAGAGALSNCGGAKASATGTGPGGVRGPPSIGGVLQR
jgi:hypothetical protein